MSTPYSRDSNNRPLEVPTWGRIRHERPEPGALYRHPRRAPVLGEGPLGGGRWPGALPGLDEQEGGMDGDAAGPDDETREGWR